MRQSEPENALDILKQTLSDLKKEHKKKGGGDIFKFSLLSVKSQMQSSTQDQQTDKADEMEELKR